MCVQEEGRNDEREQEKEKDTNLESDIREAAGEIERGAVGQRGARRRDTATKRENERRERWRQRQRRRQIHIET